MNRFALAAIAALLPSLAFCQDVPLEVVGDGVKQVTVVSKFPVTVKAPIDGFFDWTAPADVIGVDKGRVYEIKSAPKGMRVIGVRIRYAKITGGQIEYVTKFGEIPLYFGEPVPGPSPDPKPDPKPEPKPEPPPIALPGLRALVVAEFTRPDEAAKERLLTPRQIDELWGESMAVYVREKFAKDAAGVPEFRRFDKNQDESKLAPAWQQAFKAWRDAGSPVPGIVISNGKTGTAEKLPERDIVELIKKFELK